MITFGLDTLLLLRIYTFYTFKLETDYKFCNEVRGCFRNTGTHRNTLVFTGTHYKRGVWDWREMGRKEGDRGVAPLIVHPTLIVHVNNKRCDWNAYCRNAYCSFCQADDKRRSCRSEYSINP